VLRGVSTRAQQPDDPAAAPKQDYYGEKDAYFDITTNDSDVILQKRSEGFQIRRNLFYYAMRYPTIRREECVWKRQREGALDAAWKKLNHVLKRGLMKWKKNIFAGRRSPCRPFPPRLPMSLRSRHGDTDYA